ncbi:hypothetical protein H9I32_07730 [Bacillus sp. Xin]|uniref:hypothetical protein n=1 Tax=unclassified Bacillus (in: firmicutes) TaxID=185979 RepID=UPI0015740CE6|nr:MULTISPECIES: hypothetical protein [unclassified Bacillus (in: firmicutes)]MBC6972306.1 hypothetical protein [Bacillus sp. Xin]NSW38203.1 hypothetical protein [Bacillus sp. Xin1]HEK9100460.1 hypothetical protein [Bacillus pseudomycoides]HEK9104299.1 hypothetical protein [Bacillus pseudomycoides]
MDYLMEAILLVLAIVLPLTCVLIFLKTLIGNLGDSTNITKLPQEKENEKE